MNLVADINALSAWTTFYEIVGCSGGALVGLQFVVVALIANTRGRADSGAINAFGTPNVVHFALTLTISAIMSAPWPSSLDISIAMGIFGLLGLAYSVAVCNRARHQTAYKPVLEDWIFYSFTPLLVYAEIVTAAVVLQLHEQVGLFLIAGGAVGLLLLGIRNSWDSITHVVVTTSANDSTNPR